MSGPKIVLNKAGVRDMLRSPEMQAVLEERGGRIADAAGDGHRVEVEVGPNRARAAVITDTFEAVVSESKDKTLTRAIDAAR
jgi:hypothetical protein